MHTAKSLIVTFNTCMCLIKINCLACIKNEYGSFPEGKDRQYLSEFFLMFLLRVGPSSISAISKTAKSLKDIVCNPPSECGSMV